MNSAVAVDSSLATAALAKGGSEQFYATLPRIASFEALADPQLYRPLPDDWIVGLSDVVGSTEAIKAGRYKAVNRAGAAVIAAVSNAVGDLDFPYVFAGDGMCYAVPPGLATRARQALGRTIAWVGSELELKLRGGEIAAAQIRKSGHDVRVARFAPSPDVDYAMFSGGGLVWAEEQLKTGGLTLVAPDPSSPPDLSGLTCRFNPVQAQHGLMLSVIVSPRRAEQDAGFQTLVAELLDLVEKSPEAAFPVREDALRLPWLARDFTDEVRLQRKIGQSLFASFVSVGVFTAFAAFVFKAGRRIGSFSPAAYRRQLVANSDHRKFEDRLMMTVDCSPALADAIEACLSRARDRGAVNFGLQRQSSALITCVVPSHTRRDHVHFIDGAAGGYALAAMELKASTAASFDGGLGRAPLPVTSSPGSRVNP